MTKEEKTIEESTASSDDPEKSGHKDKHKKKKKKDKKHKHKHEEVRKNKKEVRTDSGKYHQGSESRNFIKYYLCNALIQKITHDFYNVIKTSSMRTKI